MTDSGAVTIAVSFLAGSVLGAFFYGGLWLTVQALPKARRPGLLILGSFLARSLLAVGGFYLVSKGEWLPLVSALAGFIITRLVVTILAHPRETAGKQEAL